MHQPHSNYKMHIDNLFFDPHRYDISRVGRYKYNKKLGISDRLRGFRLAAPIVNDLTGEIIAEEGELVTKERAWEIEQAGAKIAYVTVEGQEEPVKVISNQMVDIKGYIPYLSDEELRSVGINEHVRYTVLMDVLSADQKEKLKAEEREWIIYKDNAVKEAGAEAEGGSLQPMLEYDMGAEITKARVYELKEILLLH